MDLLSVVAVNLTALLVTLVVFQVTTLCKRRHHAHPSARPSAMPLTVPDGLPAIISSIEVNSQETTHLDFASPAPPGRQSQVTPPTVLRDFALEYVLFCSPKSISK